MADTCSQAVQGKKKDFLSGNVGFILTALLCNILWGSASACIKVGYKLFQVGASAVTSQIFFAGLRFTLSGVMTLLFGSLLSRHFLKPEPHTGGRIFALAMVQTVIQYAFFYPGLSVAPSFKSCIIRPSSCFFALLIASLLFRQEKLTLRKLLGCVIGFAGVVIVSLGNANAGGFRWNGEGFLLLSTVSYSFSTVLVKRYSRENDPVTLSAWQFLLGGGLMAVVGALLGGQLHPVSPWAWLLLVYLGFLSAMAYTLWSLLLQRHPVSKVMIFTFTNPVFGVILSALLLGEDKLFDPLQLAAALVLVCLGVWIVNRTAAEPKKAAD